jgi:hypothetical protein
MDQTEQNTAEGLTKEAVELLKKAVYCFNTIPNKRVGGLVKDTYQMASEIERFLKTMKGE